MKTVKTGVWLTFLGSIKNSCCVWMSELAAVYELCPALSMTLLHTRRLHSSLRMSLSVHSLCHVGVMSHSGANSRTMGQVWPSVKVLQLQLGMITLECSAG